MHFRTAACLCLMLLAACAGASPTMFAQALARPVPEVAEGPAATPRRMLAMSKSKKKRAQVVGGGRSSPSAGEVVKILYAPQETGPAELLGDSLARILDVPVLTDAFWRDDIVRLGPAPAGPFPTVVEVVFARHGRRSQVGFFGGRFVADHLMDLFRLLGCDCTVIKTPTEEKGYGVLSIAHPAGFDPAALVRVLGAHEPE
jgi:hypothetical protein